MVYTEMQDENKENVMSIGYDIISASDADGRYSEGEE